MSPSVTVCLFWHTALAPLKNSSSAEGGESPSDVVLKYNREVIKYQYQKCNGRKIDILLLTS
jgi:hypothetical protein